MSTPVVSPSKQYQAVGVPFQYQVVATSNPATWAISGSVPGVSFSAATGLLQGTPTATGTFNLYVTATNAAGTSAAALIILKVNTGEPFVLDASFNCKLGIAIPLVYLQAVVPVKNPTQVPQLSEVVVATLPAGLTFTQSISVVGRSENGAILFKLGTIAGTPSDPVAYNIETAIRTIDATNSYGTGRGFAKILIDTFPPVPPSSSPPVVPDATVNGTVGIFLTYDTNIVNTIESVSATVLPDGLILDYAGNIYGTPAEAGTFPVTIRATNSAGTGSGTVTFDIDSDQPVVDPPADAPPDANLSLEINLVTGSVAVTNGQLSAFYGEQIVVEANFVPAALAGNVTNVSFKLKEKAEVQQYQSLLENTGASDDGKNFLFPATTFANDVLRHSLLLLDPVAPSDAVTYSLEFFYAWGGRTRKSAIVDFAVRRPEDMDAVDLGAEELPAPGPGSPSAYYTAPQVDAVFAAHTNRVDNPHAVTKAQVGLGNVPNLDTTVAIAQASLVPYAYLDYRQQALGGVSNRIAGKVASAAQVNGNASAGNNIAMFLTDVGTANTYPRNPALWCADFVPDLTCFSVWNSRQHALQGGVLITPGNALFAEHFSGLSGPNPMQAGDVIRFVDALGGIHDGTLTGTPVRVGTSDFCVGTFAAPLPPSIRPAQILPAGLPAGFLPPGTPILYGTQDKRIYLAQAGAFSFTTVTDGIRLVYSTGAYAPWGGASGNMVRVGDSGSPIFVVTNGRAVLLSLWHATDRGDSVAAAAAQITPLLAPGCALDVATITLLGEANNRAVVGSGPLVSLNGGLIDPQYLPAAAGGTTGAPTYWDGAADLAADNTMTTVVLNNTSGIPAGAVRKLTLPASPVEGQRFRIILRASFGAGSVQVAGVGASSAGAVTLSGTNVQREQTLTYYAAKSSSTGTAIVWHGEQGNVAYDRQSLPTFPSLNLTGQLFLAPGVVIANDTHANLANTVLATDASGVFAPIALAAGKSIRSNAAGSALETFAPWTDGSAIAPSSVTTPTLTQTQGAGQIWGVGPSSADPYTYRVVLNGTEMLSVNNAGYFNAARIGCNGTVALASDGAGVAGTFSTVSASGPVKLGSYTVATVPSAASFAAYYIDVSNASAGAGQFRSNGTNWVRPYTGQVLA